MDKKIRCPWAGNTQIYIDYHDSEWARPVYDDNKLFEMLILEGMQAGLAWITVLNKRAAFREAFDGFEPNKIALYDEAKIQELMADEKIIRNRLKIEATINNAKVFLDVTEKHGSFSDILWEHVNHTPVVGHRKTIEDIPATTPESDKLSKNLKKMGFKFVGSTTIYAFMQATGMVNDHITQCFAYEEILRGQSL